MRVKDRVAFPESGKVICVIAISRPRGLAKKLLTIEGRKYTEYADYTCIRKGKTRSYTIFRSLSSTSGSPIFETSPKDNVFFGSVKNKRSIYNMNETENTLCINFKRVGDSSEVYVSIGTVVSDEPIYTITGEIKSVEARIDITPKNKVYVLMVEFTDGSTVALPFKYQHKELKVVPVEHDSKNIKIKDPFTRLY